MPNRIVRFVLPVVTLVAVAFVGGCEANSPSMAAKDMAAPPPMSPAPEQLSDGGAGVSLGKAAVATRPALRGPMSQPASVGEAFASGNRTAESPTPGQSFALPSQEAQAGAMLVRTGQASVQVDSLEIGINRIRVMAQRTGAIIANTSMQGGKDQVRAASIELRIPSARFDEAISGLSPIGTLESVNVSVQDVGEEYVDIQARVTNARRLEQRLIELLANRTGKLSDVMSVERELARVREEIERYEGRLRYLASRASVSTLTVSVHEPPPLVANRPGTHPIRDAFVQAWRNIVSVTAAIIASLGVVIPLGLLGLVVVLVGRRIIAWRLPTLAAQKPAGTE